MFPQLVVVLENMVTTTRMLSQPSPNIELNINFKESSPPTSLALAMLSHQMTEYALVNLLSQCFNSSRCRFTRHQTVIAASSSSRWLHTARARQQRRVPQSGAGARDSEAANIAVLGGGITGLASAHYLTRELPHAKVTIYDENNRLGGWVKSKRVDIGNGHVVFEQGPRTLRPASPAGLVTLDIVSRNAHT